MGRKPDPRFQGEAVSDYKKRPIACRVKFKLKSNSVKMYDKCSVLRIETTINNPCEFRVFGTVHHHDGTESKQWKSMGKSIQQEIVTICSGKTVKGKRVSCFNVGSPDIMRVMETLSVGRYLINGFRNKDISEPIFPKVQDAKKRSSKTSCRLKKLR
jgi:hypothetical protein